MRVVVTGYGLITAVGNNADETWEALVNCRSGIGNCNILHASGSISTLSGQVRSEPECSCSMPDRSIRLGCTALQEAVERAGLSHSSPYLPQDRALCLGSSLGAARKGELFHHQWIHDGLTATDKSLLFEYPLHAIADAISAKFDLHGPRIVHSNACAAGTVAIGHAYELLHDAQAKIVMAGGVDPLAYFSYAGFSCLGAVSPQQCAPYTRSDGLNLGEGSGFLILEEYSQAMDRGAPIFAELLGFGLSADAYHPTAPDPHGKGALTAVLSALRMASLDCSDVDYINGHGTGTPANDSGELKTIAAIGANIPISSTKSMVGHTLGAAGAVGAVVSVMTLVHQRMHPTLVPDDEAAQNQLQRLLKAGTPDILPNEARESAVNVVVSNSFAFGGNNASIVLAREGVSRTREKEMPRLDRDRIAVTGIAAMAGKAMTTDEVRDAFLSGRRLYEDSITLEDGNTFPVGLPDYDRLCAGVNPRVLRRLDPLGKIAVHVVSQLFSQSSIRDTQLQTTGVIFATGIGPLSTVEAFQRGLMAKGRGDSRLFPNTVMNAAAGNVAATFGLHGPTATICAGTTSGITALQLAYQMLRNRSCERLLVVAADETPECLLAGYSRYRNMLSPTQAIPYGNTGVVFSSGAVAALLEVVGDDGSAQPLVRIPGIGMASDGSGPGGFSSDDEAWARSLDRAINRAGITAADIDVVIAGADGRNRTDDIEASAFTKLGLRDSTPIIAPLGLTGELAAPGPLFGLLLAMWLKEGNGLYCADSPQFAAPHKNRPLRALVSSFSIGGNFQSYVVEA